ncbi:MAG: hypothetical protein ACRDOJ_10295, partial [Nocardioidaceae bacterium]
SESPTGVPADRSTEPAAEVPAGAPADAPAAEPAERAAPTDESSPERSRSIREDDAEAGPPTWVLALLAGLLVVALALDGFVVWRELSQRQAEEQSARALHSALIQAPAVAEQAAEAVLSYRYDTLDKDVAQARRYLSDGYRPDYVASIREVVQAPAKEIGAVVEANVLASGVVEASGERSDVLLFVNQTTTSAADAQPQEALNRVVLTMIRQDGRWVVDEVQAF